MKHSAHSPIVVGIDVGGPTKGFRAGALAAIRYHNPERALLKRMGSTAPQA